MLTACFQSVYDYPYLSSSANHIFDITVGVSAESSLYSGVTEQKSKKLNIYNQMAQVLVGYDHTGSIQRFDEDGDILAGGTKLDNVFFMNYSRLLSKDEIKKGTFELELGVNSDYDQAGAVFSRRIKITDFSGSNGYLVQLHQLENMGFYMPLKVLAQMMFWLQINIMLLDSCFTKPVLP